MQRTKAVEDLAVEQFIPQAGIEAFDIWGLYAREGGPVAVGAQSAAQRRPDGISVNAASPGMIETELPPLLSQPDFMTRRIA